MSPIASNPVQTQVQPSRLPPPPVGDVAKAQADGRKSHRARLRYSVSSKFHRFSGPFKNICLQEYNELKNILYLIIVAGRLALGPGKFAIELLKIRKENKLAAREADDIAAEKARMATQDPDWWFDEGSQTVAMTDDVVDRAESAVTARYGMTFAGPAAGIRTPRAITRTDGNKLSRADVVAVFGPASDVRSGLSPSDWRVAESARDGALRGLSIIENIDGSKSLRGTVQDAADLGTYLRLVGRVHGDQPDMPFTFYNDYLNRIAEAAARFTPEPEAVEDARQAFESERDDLAWLGAERAAGPDFGADADAGIGLAGPSL